MAWPTRADLWSNRFDEAKRDYATVAASIADFEPVVMVCCPGQAAAVRSACPAGVVPLEIPINDSWSRDSGPAFVRNPAGDVAVVGFGFNAWGNRWHPHDDDALLSGRLADHFGLPFFRAPLVLEGGSFFVDGEGTIVTTEQCLLNQNRNPHLSRDQIEDALKQYLGATKVVWLPFGHSTDVGPAGTDGHVDGVFQYAGPAGVMLEATSDTTSPDFVFGLRNLAVLRRATDAAGRAFAITILDPGPAANVSYANHYLANGAVIVPLSGNESDVAALATLRSLHPHREVVGVPGGALAHGGGGPHCITQQIPAGVTL
jgi:agmatine deiminase